MICAKAAALTEGEWHVARQTEHRCSNDRSYTHLGLDVADARAVVVKTASNFQFFSRWRSGLIRVDSPGTTQSDLTALEWKRLPRPIYPLDPLTDWRA
jgi:microcystin degradation protein MlrC